jgi:hypothetical protein
MRRREFLIILVLSATMPCAHAQQPGKLYRIAIVSPSAPVAEMTDTGIPTFSALLKEITPTWLCRGTEYCSRAILWGGTD